MKVYIVHRGSYSDRRILRVFLSKEMAESFITAIEDDGWDETDIEEWETDDNSLNINELMWEVSRMINRGQIAKIPKGQSYWSAEFIGDSLWDKDRCKENAFEFYDEDDITFFLYAPNKEAALKIAHERYGAVKVMMDSGQLRKRTLYSFPSYQECTE